MSEENKKTSEWKEREIGALWKKEGANQNYYSGRIDIAKFNSEGGKLQVVGFANKNKKEYPNSPDVILYFSPPMEKKSETVTQEVDDESPML